MDELEPCPLDKELDLYRCVFCTPQYRHLIPAPVDRTSASAWSYKHPWITYQEYKPSISINHVACESKLRLVVRAFMHPCPGNQVAISRSVVHYARSAHAFSAGIKCCHCSGCSSIACKDRLCLSFSTQVVHHYYMMRHVQTSHGKG